MSSGSPAPSVVAPSNSSIAPSVGTLESTPSKKKRTIVVVRRRPRNSRIPGSSDEDEGRSPVPPKKRTLLVSRRPRASEGQLFDDDAASHHLAGASGAAAAQGGAGEGNRRRSNHRHISSTVAGKLEWLPGGRVVDRSVLGTAAAFEEVDAQLGWAARPEEREEDLLRSGTESSLRSLRSQKSKQSLRSLRSTGLQPIDGSTNGRASHPGTSRDDESGLQIKMERYLRRIAEAKNTAIRNRAASERKEAKLMEHVGLTEKLTMQREGNSMRQWKRRQRDWQLVSQDMAAKTGKVPEDLVMSTADEYRERSEEYQLIQCAVPTCEKFSSDMFWVMSLRGFGERKCNVGNIFSGLTCAINDRVPPPRAVRKPTGRPADATRKRTWRDSEALAARKRHLALTLKNLRPQQFEPDETVGLLVQGEDLLEWAAMSSRQYFRLRHLQESEAVGTGLKALEGESTTTLAVAENLRLSEGSSGRADTGTGFAPRAGPAMEVVSPKTLLIETKAGETTLKQATITTRNTGSTVLFFSWSRVPRGDTIVSVNGTIGGASNGQDAHLIETETGEDVVAAGSGAQGTRTQRTKQPGKTITSTSGKAAVVPQALITTMTARHAALRSPDGRFFCFQTTGTLLPGETATISFSFKTADAGVFSDRWRLETAPPAAFVFLAPRPRPSSAQATATAPTSGLLNNELNQASSGHGVLGGPALSALVSSSGGGGIVDHAALDRRKGDEKIERRGSGSFNGSRGIEVGLTGVALAPDTRGHVRKRLSEGVAMGIFGAKVEEIVREVVRGVRTPVREEEIRRRQRKNFVSTNAEQGLYFTPRLYDGFVALLQRAKAIAVAAEAGTYAIDASKNGDIHMAPIDSSDTLASRQSHTQGAETEECTEEDGLEAVLPGTTQNQTSFKGSTGKREGGDGEEEKGGDGSECSTRPVSARSSSGDSYVSAGGDENDPDDPEDEGDPSKDRHQRAVAFESENAESRGNPRVREGRGTKAEQAEEDPTMALADKERGIDSGSGGLSGAQMAQQGEGEWRGDVQEGESQVRDAEALLRGMLESLDCAEWDGGVSTVLDAIEDLTRWIPASLLPPTPPPTATDLGGDLLSPRAEGALSYSGAASTAVDSPHGDSDDRGRGAEAGEKEEIGATGKGGSEVDEEEDEEDDDDEDEDEEDEEEEDNGEEDEGESEIEDESDEDEEAEQQHPVLVEQKTLRAQWRRLVLDAKLEPETDCTKLMREAVEGMVRDVAGAMEEVHRQAAASGAAAASGKTTGTAAPGGGGETQTPRKGVLGYDEDSIANWALACPADPGARHADDGVGGPRARAVAAAKAGNPKASFLALAYGEVSSRVATAAESFETGLSAVESAFKTAAASARRAVVLRGPDGPPGRICAPPAGDDGDVAGSVGSVDGPPSLSRLAALKWEDIEGRRILLHADLSRGSAEDYTYGNDDRGAGLGAVKADGNGNGTGDDHGGQEQPFPEAVRLVAEQVREILSAKPAAIAIVSETAPIATRLGVADTALVSGNHSTTAGVENDAPVQAQQQHHYQQHQQGGPYSSDLAGPESSCYSSLRASAAAVSSLLGMEVDFFQTVPELAGALERYGEGRSGGCSTGSDVNDGGDGGSPPFGMVPLMMAERLSLPGVIPAPPAEEAELSDGEEERLPDFSWGGEASEAATEHAEEVEAARLAIEGPGEGDLGAMLAGTVDVTVLDAPQALYEPRRKLPWGPMPTTGLTVAGSGLHGDLTAMAYLTESSDRPLLAIVGGGSLEPRLKLIDGLLDLVDTLAVGGGLAATFIAAATETAAMGIGICDRGALEGTSTDTHSNPDSSSDEAAPAAAAAAIRRAAKRKNRRKWIGPGTAGRPRDPPDVVEAARRLLVKARKRGVEVILPSDFVVGDIEVDENGTLPGQALPEDAQDESGDDDGAAEVNDHRSDDGDGKGDNDSGSAAGDGRRAGEIGGVTAAAPDLEPEDEASGFEYDGETMDVKLEDGIPKGFRPMDIGPQTTAILRGAVGRARAVLWHGMIGVAECSAFQFGTREVLEAATSAHDSEELREVGASPVVILCGSSLGEWASRFAEGDEDAPPLGSGSGASHICADPMFCSRVLEGRTIPGLSQLSERDPPPGDADLGKVLRRGPFGEEDEEDEEDEESDANSSSES